MKIVLFYHSLLSDWNHGNAHFLRGVSNELIHRGHDLTIYEPKKSWSVENLVKDYGEQALEEFYNYYPSLDSIRYDKSLNLDEALKDADLVIVHEWNSHSLVRAIGKVRKRKSFRLLFHDTHHRAVTDRAGMADYNLSNYDGVLAYGEVIKRIYLEEGWAKRVWTWHEAADQRLFHPIESDNYLGDLVWIGNWGDDERSRELHEYLIEPVKKLGLKCTIYGVRYPEEAQRSLHDAGIQYGGWLPNFKVPEVFSKYRLTVHVPRRPYVESLPGIPTIRPFEALSCGIPMISSPWNDVENLFRPGTDFTMVNSGEEMTGMIDRVLNTPSIATQMTRQGRETILNRHTCSHRVDELMNICEELKVTDYSNQRITT